MIVKLGDLEIYRLSLELSDGGWRIYRSLPKAFRYGIGDQMLRSVDSIGANIAEGYGRYHYKDSAKFYYNARGSLWETKHWFLLLRKRDLITKEQFESNIARLDLLGKKLNGFIRTLGSK